MRSSGPSAASRSTGRRSSTAFSATSRHAGGNPPVATSVATNRPSTTGTSVRASARLPSGARQPMVTASTPACAVPATRPSSGAPLRVRMPARPLSGVVTRAVGTGSTRSSTVFGASKAGDDTVIRAVWERVATTSAV